MRLRLVFWSAALLAATVAGCTEGRAPLVPAPDPAITVSVEVSAPAEPGAQIAVAVRASGAAAPLAGVQGTLRFDPARLRYVGQPPGGVLVMVNARRAEQGELRLLSLDAHGLPPRSATLVFEVRAADYAAGLRFAFEAAATLGLAEVRRADVGATIVAPDLAVPAGARRMDLADWNEVLAPGLAAREHTGPARLPGQYVPNLRYGDATLNGSINVLDAAFTANVAVGNLPLLTDANRDYVIAGNVYPANLPGLGEVGDAAPPGLDAGGGYSINVLDAAVISNEAIGNDMPVAGEFIPGRASVPTNRVVLSGVLAADRTLFHDTIYELQGLVIVPGSVTLTIEAGTAIEGDAATRGALAIYRGGNIVARGTRLEPIVFTCNSTIKTRGCWGGLVLNGFSLLNNGEVLGGVDVDGCPQKTYPETPGHAGGCLIQDTSGILRYVRVEYAGMAQPGGSPLPGLALLGVGSGTVVDSVQVRESLGDGLFVGGGTVDLRNVVLTDNQGDGLRWEDGWVGRAQFVIVQQGADNGHAVHGINLATNPGAGPRSNPTISHLTISGPAAGLGAVGNGLLFEHGSAASVANAIVLRTGAAGLEIEGTESCAQAGGAAPALHFEASIFFASPEDFSSDADCLDEAAFATQPALGNRVVDPGLIAPFNTLSADLRPVAGSPATTGHRIPPAAGFFDQSAMYVGAVAPANGVASNIPWYAGWTRGW